MSTTAVAIPAGSTTNGAGSGGMAASFVPSKATGPSASPPGGGASGGSGLPTSSQMLKMLPADGKPCRVHSKYELVWCAYLGQAGAVKKIISCLADGAPCAAGITIDSPDEEGSTAVIAAAWGQQTAILKMLLAAVPSPDVNARNKTHGWTALHAAAARGYLDCVQALIEHPGINLSPVDNHGHTPSKYASHYGHEEVKVALNEAIRKREEGGLLRQCTEKCVIS